MTGMDDRLRSAMQGDTSLNANTGSAPQAGWQSIETAAARRASRRRAGQRVALVSAVVLATVFMIGTLIGGPGGGIDPADPPRLHEPADQGSATWLTGLVGWAVLALGLLLLILAVTSVTSAVRRERATESRHPLGRSPQASARHALRQAVAKPERLLALAFVLLGLGPPVWAYANYVESIGDLQARSPDFAAVEELQVTSTMRTWTPFASPLDPLISVTLSPTEPIDESKSLALVDEVLTEAGFAFSTRTDTYNRVTYGNLDGAGVAVNDSATVTSNEDGTVQVGYRLRGEPTKSWIPLAVFVGTFMIAGAGLLLMEYVWARPLGLLTLVATGVQVGLVVRGFSTARTLLMGLDRDVPLSTERADLVSAATTDTYPIGLLAVVFLLAPWSLGALAVFSDRKRTAAALAIFGVVAVIVIFVVFGSINGWVLEILE